MIYPPTQKPCPVCGTWALAVIRMSSKNAAMQQQIANKDTELEWLKDVAEMLWCVLANVSEGDWTTQTAEWQDAAALWRDNYMAVMHPSQILTAPKEAS